MRIDHVVDALQNSIGIDGPPRDLLEAIAAVLQATGKNELDSLEHAERIKISVAALIEKRKASAESAGLVHVIELQGVLRNRVGGSAVPSASDTADEHLAKSGRRQVTLIYEAIRQLSPSKFERFGAALVKSLGARVGAKTLDSGDQGIDFVGSTRIGDLLSHPKKFFRLAYDMQIDFVGQAKHYPNRTLGPSTVREMVGSLELARSRHFSSDSFKLIEDIALKSFSPVFCLIITTGPVTAGARKVADAAGIILRSGEQLATYLADRGVGIDPGNGNFSATLFDRWMIDAGSVEDDSD